MTALSTAPSDLATESPEPVVEPSLGDPYPHYAYLRRHRPLHRTARGRWIVSCHRLAVALLEEPRCQHWGRGEAAAPPPGLERSLGVALRALSPGGEKPYRKAAGKSFAPVDGSALEQRADRILGGLRSRPTLDLVADFAHPLTAGAICSLLGVSESALDRWCARLGHLDGGYLRLVGEDPALSGDDDAWLLESLDDLLQSKRQRPGKDLTSRLVTAAAASADRGAGEEPASDGFLRDLILLLLYAGHQNMVNFLALATLALCRHPEIALQLRQAPERLGDAVLELMRYDSPVQYLPLVAREPVTVEGQRIEPGEEILICVGAANRDPEVFPDPTALISTGAPGSS
nr:biotin biosynthesis cytochrome P450-like [Nerophis lumbriciformis]